MLGVRHGMPSLLGSDFVYKKGALFATQFAQEALGHACSNSTARMCLKNTGRIALQRHLRPANHRNAGAQPRNVGAQPQGVSAPAIWSGLVWLEV